MKTGRTIQEIGAEILRQSQAKEDYLVNTNSIVIISVMEVTISNISERLVPLYRSSFMKIP